MPTPSMQLNAKWEFVQAVVKHIKSTKHEPGIGYLYRALPISLQAKLLRKEFK